MCQEHWQSEAQQTKAVLKKTCRHTELELQVDVLRTAMTFKHEISGNILAYGSESNDLARTNVFLELMSVAKIL